MTQNFSGFGLPPKLLQSLARIQFQAPTPIQSEAIPLALEGRDILGSAQTGTGKTGAFGIPIVAKLMENHDAAALVLTPTRELAAQVMASIQQLIPVADIKTALLIGGEAMPKQFRQLQAHPRVIVGTPGRINDHLSRNKHLLDKVRFLVLDETDRMLDMGFGVQIDKIVAFLPQERQTMLFSATLPQGIVKLSAKYLKNPERIKVGSTIHAAPNIDQKIVRLSDEEKGSTLFGLLKEAKGSVIVFVKTKYATERLVKKLVQQKVNADALHGDLRQSRRERVIRGFRDKKFPILVATDIAARGLDVPHIETVINYDLPQCPEDFIHRIGRTARAGASGQAISFVTPSDNGKWKAIHHLMNPGEPQPKSPEPSKKPHNGHAENRRPHKRRFFKGKKSDNHRPERHKGVAAR
jgi:superfamily II DNA/RNA helicase